MTAPAFLSFYNGTSSTSCPSGVPRWKDLGPSGFQAGEEGSAVRTACLYTDRLCTRCPALQANMTKHRAVSWAREEEEGEGEPCKMAWKLLPGKMQVNEVQQQRCARGLKIRMLPGSCSFSYTCQIPLQRERRAAALFMQQQH